MLVEKAADTVVNNSAAFADDPHLVTPANILPNAKYRVTVVLQYDSENLTADLNFRLAGPAGCTALGYGDQPATNTAAAAGAPTVSRRTLVAIGSGNPSGGAGVGTPVTTMATYLVSNGANAGTLKVQWGQNVANATDTTVKAGSWLLVERLT